MNVKRGFAKKKKICKLEKGLLHGICVSLIILFSNSHRN